MQGFKTMFVTNLKMLLRNKGYLAFLILLPILSVIMLNINNMESTALYGEDSVVVYDLENENESLLNISNNKINIKVYDCSNSKLSDYVLSELAKTGSYSIFRTRASSMELNEAREKALYSANHNVLGAIIFIPNTFEEEILQGKDSNFVVFEAIPDGRINMLENNINTFLQSVYHYAAITDYQLEPLINVLNTSVNNEITKDIVNIEVGDALNLSVKQKGKSSSIGYSLSFLSISFLFSGIFIAATVIEERQNWVYNRFLLTTSSMYNYGLVKFIMVVMTVLIETGIIALAIKLIVRENFGIPYVDYLFLVFCMGLIFNLMSVVIGIILNDVMSSNYIAFLIWCLSCLLAGLYFPLDSASKLWTGISMLMPQRWVLNACEMLMAGKSGVFSTFIMVVGCYLIIILSIGMIGIRLRRREA